MEAIVAVDHTAIEIVEIASGKTTAIELYHRAQVGWNDWQRSQHHPLGAVAAFAEILDDAQALGRLFAALLAARGANLLAQFLGHLVQVNLSDDIAYGFGPHCGSKDIAPTVSQFTIAILGQELLFFQRLEIFQVAVHLPLDLLVAAINFAAQLIDLRTQLTAGMIAESRDLIVDILLFLVGFTLQRVKLLLDQIVNEQVMFIRNGFALLDNRLIRPTELLRLSCLLADAHFDPSLQRLRLSNRL